MSTFVMQKHKYQRLEQRWSCDQHPQIEIEWETVQIGWMCN